MQITNLYRELLKRLDDSSDDIRLDACLALCQYVRVVPQDYDRTHYKYLLRGLLVHLDDTNPKIQVAFNI
jgi:dynein assembly factor 5